MMLALLAVLLALPAHAKVHYARDEALTLVFPDAEVAARTVILSEAEAAAIEERTGKPVASKLVTYHEARRDGSVVGYGIIDMHVVRTLPEAILVVLTPAGTIEQVLLLAFQEPPEYAPSERWLRQFDGRGIETTGWRVGRDLHGISGATLTAYAVAGTVRRAVALFDLVIRSR